MTADRTKRTKTTVKAGPAAQWRGRVEAADWTTIGAELNTAHLPSHSPTLSSG
jgi:hypothetical protein